MQYLRTNTATRITVGPFFDQTDGVTPETALTVTSEKLTMTVDDGGVPTLVLDTNPTASGGNNDMVHITGDDAGYYDLELTAANVNYFGRARLALTNAAAHCPVFHEFMIIPAVVYDAMILGTDLFDVSMTQIAGAAVNTASAQLGVNAVQIGATAQTGRDIGASVLLSPGTGTGQVDITSGVVKANIVQLLATAFTESGAGRLVAGFKKFFDVVTPASTMELLTAVSTVTTLTNAPSDSSGTTTLLSRLSSARAGYLDNLNVGGNVASSAEATAIQNNTRVVRIVPSLIERPDSSNQDYVIELFLYDEVGNMEAPDSAPTLSVVDEAGNSRSGNLDSTTMSSVSTGRYRSIYNVESTDDLEQLIFVFSVVEGGATRLYGNTTMVVDTTAVDFTSSDRSKLDAVYNKLPSKTYLTGSANSDGDVQLDEATGTPADSSGTTTLLSRLSATRAGYLDNLSGGAVALASKLTKYFQLALRKDSAIATDNATELTALNANGGSGGGSFDNTTEALEAIRDRGDAAWTTGGGGSISDILNIVPIIPGSVDLANTATWRLALMLMNSVDDLPTTGEITPGTIDIDRKAIGATSWTNVVSAAACSEAAGMVYYDVAFAAGSGYAEGDSIRITFKSQKITVSANDYEISDATGRMFYCDIRQTERGTNGAYTGTPPTVAQICTEMDNNSTQLAKIGTPAGASVSADIAAIKSDTGTLVSRMTSARAGYLDNLNVGGAVASQADINALNQSASRRIIITSVEQFERPESGNVTYTVEARTYDGDGAATNADTTPTLTATGIVTGSLAGNLSAATNPATGVYRWTYTVSSSATLEQVRFDVSAALSASTFTLSLYAQVADFVSATFTTTDRAHVDAIYNKLPSKTYLTGSSNSDGDVQQDEMTGGLSTTAKNDVNAQADQALADYDGPTYAEMNSAIGAAQDDIADVQADVDDLQTRLPAALDGAGNMKSNALSINSSTSAAAQLAKSAIGIVSGAAIAGTLSLTQMTTDLTETTDDHYKDLVIKWTSGPLAGQSASITAYNGTTKMLTYSAVTDAPQAGNTFVLM